jgi:hypothetical protein
MRVAQRHVHKLDGSPEHYRPTRRERCQSRPAALLATGAAALVFPAWLNNSVPIPKFASTRRTSDANFGIKGTLSTF